MIHNVRDPDCGYIISAEGYLPLKIAPVLTETAIKKFYLTVTPVMFTHDALLVAGGCRSRDVAFVSASSLLSPRIPLCPLEHLSRTAWLLPSTQQCSTSPLAECR